MATRFLNISWDLSFRITDAYLISVTTWAAQSEALSTDRNPHLMYIIGFNMANQDGKKTIHVSCGSSSTCKMLGNNKTWQCWGALMLVCIFIYFMNTKKRSLLKYSMFSRLANVLYSDAKGQSRDDAAIFAPYYLYVFFFNLFWLYFLFSKLFFINFCFLLAREKISGETTEDFIYLVMIEHFFPKGYLWRLKMW